MHARTTVKINRRETFLNKSSITRSFDTSLRFVEVNREIRFIEADESVAGCNRSLNHQLLLSSKQQWNSL